MESSSNANIGRLPLNLQSTTLGNSSEKRYGRLPFRRYEFVGTGKLVLSIDEWVDSSRRSWADGKEQRIENCLNPFVVGLVSVSEAKKKAAEDRRARQEELAAKQRRAEAHREIRRREEDRFDDLRQQAAAWETARQMRRYVRAVRRAVRSGAADSFEASIPWLEWAERRAAELDPLTDLDRVIGKLIGAAENEHEFSEGLE